MLRLILLVFCVISSAMSAAAPSRAGAPNIVFILIDNCGKEWFGSYGSEENCTPNIDRLARGGLMVANCYTPVVCGPSRTVALTGRYLLRSGFTYHHDAGLYSGGGLDPAREITFARPLRDAGYATAIAGKWQINNLYDEPDVIKRHGFNESLLCPLSIDRDHVGQADYDNYMRHVLADDADFTSQFITKIESRYWDPVLIRNGVREKHPGKFGPDVVHAFAADFIRRHRDRPFLLYYPMFLTHGKSFTEHVVPTPLNRDAKQDERARYADMLRYADKLVGDLVAQLEREGLRDNTIIFVATDNGTHSTLSARANGRVVKGGLYTLSEPGGNVPLIVNCPKLVPGGRTLALADFSDLFPTFCELAGAKLPTDRVVDGRSFAAAVRGEKFSGRTWMFNQYGKERVVSDGRYKLWGDGRLFDLVNDFTEQQDLRDSRDPAAASARRTLQAALDSLPADAAPPFLLRSQSIFRARTAARQERR
jgi:arylsulfatase A-like enzyme